MKNSIIFVFLSCSIFCSFTLGKNRELSFNGKPIADGKPGALTGKLVKAYKALVKKETSALK